MSNEGKARHDLSFDIHRSLILNANDRPSHWSQRSNPTADLVMLGAVKGRALPKMSAAKLIVPLDYPDRRRHDALNLYPTAKAIVDGIVNKGKGPLPDDNDDYLVGPWLVSSHELSGTKDIFRFHFQFTELENIRDW